MISFLQKISILFFILLMVSCDRSELEITEEAYPDGIPKAISTFAINSTDTSKILERHFYPNGELKMQGPFKNGKRDGKWESYYSNGVLWSSLEYDSGVRSGISLVYYESGELHISGQFKDDRASGIWTWFDEKGKEIDQIDYSK